MSRAKVVFKDLEKFQKKIQKAQQSGINEFIQSTAKELADILLQKIEKRTPSGTSGSTSGTSTGTLRDSWTIGEIQKKGNEYVIEIFNPVEYASYIEYGHRTAGGSGWVEGKFMMTISEEEVRSMAPALLESKLNIKLEELFNNDN